MSWQPTSGPEHDDRYRSPQYNQQEPPRSNVWLWVLIGAGGMGVVGIIVCCGGMIWLASLGGNDEEKFLQALIEDEPVIIEHIGNIESLTTDWTSSMATDDDKLWYYDIEGDVGSGVLNVRNKEVFALEYEYEWITLETPDGESYDVYP